MTFAIRASRNGVEIDKYPDTVCVAFLDETFDRAPAVEIHLSWFAIEVRTDTERRAQCEVTYRETNGVAARDVFEPVQVVIG